MAYAHRRGRMADKVGERPSEGPRDPDPAGADVEPDGGTVGRRGAALQQEEDDTGCPGHRGGAERHEGPGPVRGGPVPERRSVYPGSKRRSMRESTRLLP